MKSGYFRVLRFEPEKGELELSEHGLDEPGARIAYCEWNELYEEPYVPYGLIVLDDGQRFECDQLVHEIFRHCDSNSHRQKLWKTLGKTQMMPITPPVKP